VSKSLSPFKFKKAALSPLSSKEHFHPLIIFLLPGEFFCEAHFSQYFYYLDSTFSNSKHEIMQKIS